MELKSKKLIISVIIYLSLGIINLIPIWVMAIAFANTGYSQMLFGEVISSIVLGVLLGLSYAFFIKNFMKSSKIIESEGDLVFRKQYYKITSRRFYIIIILSFIFLLIFAFSRIDFRIFTYFLTMGAIIIASIVLNKLNNRISKQIELFKGFQSLIANRDKIDIDELKNHFKFDSKSFYNKLLEWSERYDMKIDGDYVVFNTNTVSDFIDELDREFGKWGKIKQLKDKIEDKK